ncbi:MAG: hypothetical protein IKB09_01060 [Oscillospiraceae bacterium]|nr:hypothetical protein [Oscillospiraceae bacterium]
MENKTELWEKLEKNTRQQLMFTKVLCLLCAILMVCMLIMAVSISGVAKEVVTLARPLQEVAGQVTGITAQAETVMENLDSVAKALAEADLSGMAQNINALTADSQSVVTEAMEKLDTIDIETLNKAIADLADAAELLGKVSRIFG